MDDAVAVCVRERVGDLDGVAERVAHIQAVARDRVGKRPAGHVLHGDEARAILRIQSVDRGDVGMVEGRGGLRLLLESAQPLWIRRHLWREDLDGDIALQLHVARLVHHSHAALAEEAVDFVRTQACARVECHTVPRL